MRGRGTYDKLVHSAGLLFQDNGYVAVSIRDIVSAVNVPKGTFYNYFASKEALASLIVGQKSRELDDSLSALDDDTELLDGVRRHLRALGKLPRAGLVSPVRLLGTLAAEVSVLPLPLRVLVADGLRGWTDRLATLLGKAQGHGNLTQTTNVRVLAVVLVNNLLGAAIHLKCDSGEAASQALAQIALAEHFLEKKE